MDGTLVKKTLDVVVQSTALVITRAAFCILEVVATAWLQSIFHALCMEAAEPIVMVDILVSTCASLA